jgi:glutaredoxin
MKRLACLLLLGAAFAAHAQTIYRWVDKDGNVQYSDLPPPPDARNLQTKRMGSGPSVDEEQLPYVVKIAKEKNPVSAYLTNCGEPCSDARAVLAKRGIPFLERDPEKNPADADALKKLIGTLQVPVLVVGEEQVKGFSDASWNAALDAGGYPRVNPFTKPPVPKKSEMPAPAATPSGESRPARQQ